MLEITNLVTSGWEAAIRGMRNPMNSWAKSDSCFGCNYSEHHFCNVCEDGHTGACPNYCKQYKLGLNDLDLATRLIKAGPEHAKFLRMIHVQMDIKAPLYWWKEMDTYKIGTNADSCSTMHKIAAKEFTLEDFSCEHLFGPDDMLKYDERNDIAKDNALAAVNVDENWCYFTPQGYIQMTCNILNHYRQKYLESKDKIYWWQIIQLLPSSYNQLRTWDASLQAILNILQQRKGHKLDEWHTFRRICFEQIPYCKEFYTVMTGDDDYETSQ